MGKHSDLFAELRNKKATLQLLSPVPLGLASTSLFYKVKVYFVSIWDRRVPK
jgi:hypothetical protein